MSTFKEKVTVYGWEDIQGLSVNVTGNVNMTYELTFAGLYGGADTPINDFEFWNFTYYVPEGFVGQPSISLNVGLL